MKQFDYMEKWKKLLTPQIVSYLTTIHEYKGKPLIKLRVFILLMND